MTTQPTNEAATDGCPTGCGRAVRNGQLMCGTCWREVPKHLQRDVNRTWREWRKDFGGAEAMHRYRAARDAALAAIK